MKFSFRIFIAVATILVLETSAHPFGPQRYREEWGVPEFPDQTLYPQKHPPLQFNGYNPYYPSHIVSGSGLPFYQSAPPFPNQKGGPYSLRVTDGVDYEPNDVSELRIMHVPLRDSESFLQLPAFENTDDLKIIPVNSHGNLIEDSKERGDHTIVSQYRSEQFNDEHRRGNTNERDRKRNNLARVLGVSSDSFSNVRSDNSEKKTQGRNNDDYSKYPESQGKQLSANGDGWEFRHTTERQQNYNPQPIPQIQPNLSLQPKPLVKPTLIVQPAQNIIYNKTQNDSQPHHLPSVKPYNNQPSAQPKSNPKQAHPTKYPRVGGGNAMPADQQPNENPTKVQSNGHAGGSNDQSNSNNKGDYRQEQRTNSQNKQPITPPQKGQPKSYPQPQSKVPIDHYPKDYDGKPSEQRTHASYFRDSNINVDDIKHLDNNDGAYNRPQQRTDSQPIQTKYLEQAQPITPPQKGQPKSYPQPQSKVPIDHYPKDNDYKPLEQGASDNPTDHPSHLDKSGENEDFFDNTTTNDQLNGYDGKPNNSTKQSDKNNALVDTNANQTTETIYDPSQTNSDQADNKAVYEEPDFYNSSETNDKTPSQPTPNNSAVPIANNSPKKSSPDNYPDSIPSSSDDSDISSLPFKDTVAPISLVDSPNYNSHTYKSSIQSSAPTPAAPKHSLSFSELLNFFAPKPQSTNSSPVQPAMQPNAIKNYDVTTTKTDNNIGAPSTTVQDDETGPGDGNKPVNADDGKGSVSPYDYRDGTSDDSSSTVAVKSDSQDYGTDDNGASDGITLKTTITSVDGTDNTQSNNKLAQKSKSTDVAQKSVITVVKKSETAVAQKSTTGTTKTQSDSDEVENPDSKTAAIQSDKGEAKKYGSVAEKSKSVVGKKSDSGGIQESKSIVSQTSAVDVASSSSGKAVVVTETTNTRDLKELSLAMQAFNVFIKKVCEEPKIKEYMERSFLKPIVDVINSFVRDTYQDDQILNVSKGQNDECSCGSQ